MRNLTPGVIVALLLTAVLLTTALHAADEPVVEPPKPAPLSVVISQLRKEAIAAWHRDRTWPRAESNFAPDQNWSLENDQVITALSRKLDANPAVDGYIKWQLLSFAPDISAASTDQVNRIVAQMPKPIDQPQPTVAAGSSANGRNNNGTGVSFSFFGRQGNYVRDLDPVVGDGVVMYDPKVGTVNSGSTNDAETRASIERVLAIVNDKLAEARQTVDTANQPVHAYREALLARLPTDGGIRLAVMLKDVRDRLAAGDASYREALDRTAEASKTLAADPSITPRVRRTLVQWTQAVGKMRTSVVDAVKADRRGVFSYERTTLAPRPEDVQFLLSQLNEHSGG
ncbi:hypothetical protein HED60_02980 [Planctomycetales bacterium ZRK34]|nr:hypothetical protein HED60_02980 [Planctomycetales bacterium ZRK34]